MNTTNNSACSYSSILILSQAKFIIILLRNNKYTIIFFKKKSRNNMHITQSRQFSALCISIHLKMTVTLYFIGEETEEKRDEVIYLKSYISKWKWQDYNLVPGMKSRLSESKMPTLTHHTTWSFDTIIRSLLCIYKYFKYGKCFPFILELY